MKFAYAVTTWSGAKLPETLDSLPGNARILVVDNKEGGWSLAKGWNYAVDKLLWDEAYDACIIMNDDVVLREDTGELLVWALLDGQFRENKYDDYWPKEPPRPELLLISARHASWSDACTDVVDWGMLEDAKPIWQPSPDFSCFVVNRRLGQEIGRFDENFDPAFFEDNDTHRRIVLAGFEAGAFAPYWHFRNGTIRTDSERARAVVQGGFENSKRYYCAKWGVPYDGGSPIGRETYIVPFGKI